MVGGIAGTTKVSDYERTLLRLTKETSRLDTWEGRAEIFQMRELMKLFPTRGRFVTCGFTLYTNS